MLKKHLNKAILFSVLCLLGTNSCFADYSQSAFSPLKTINVDSQNTQVGTVSIDLNKPQDNAKYIDLNENDAFKNFDEATDKFVQCNIRTSWEDFKSLINKIQSNDFMYISFANKMADLGLFDLANLAGTKVQDKSLSNVSFDAMKRFYFPRNKLRLDDELFLAEAYSNISFNNQSSEATNEILKRETLLNNSDYANYLVALGSYKSGNLSRAAKYINIAVLQNSTNLNYQKLKAEILAEKNEPEEAIKVVENLKRQNLYSYEYERKIKSLEQFVLYKVKKAQWEKDYHLGYYYYLENDSSKAVRTLQGALSARKTNKGMIYSLMSEIYLSMNEFEKAADTAKKAQKTDSKNPKALITLGDLSYRNNNYKQAIDYYKKAAGQDKKSYIPLVKEAQAYQKMNNIKKASDIYTKILKTHSDSWEAYYNVALLDQDKKIIYLKKSLAINPLYDDAWIELAKTEIDKGNCLIAQKYLANAFYIDENDFRYYYYQGLIDDNSGNYSQAKYNFKKCLKLNANYKEAQKALDAVMNNENGNVRQDNI